MQERVTTRIATNPLSNMLVLPFKEMEVRKAKGLKTLVLQKE
jgi:hypothetical protein